MARNIQMPSLYCKFSPLYIRKGADISYHGFPAAVETVESKYSNAVPPKYTRVHAGARTHARDRGETRDLHGGHLRGAGGRLKTVGIYRRSGLRNTDVRQIFSCLNRNRGSKTISFSSSPLCFDGENHAVRSCRSRLQSH